MLLSVLRQAVKRELLLSPPLCSNRRLSQAFNPNFSNHELEEDPELDLTRFGDYELVLPDDPTVEGVSHIKPASIPPHIQTPLYASLLGLRQTEALSHNFLPNEKNQDSIIALGTEAEAKIRKAGWIAYLTLRHISQIVKVGVTTAQIDDAVREFILSSNAYPSPLLYLGYPKSCCTSVNNVICHGIPDDRPLEDGDIVNVDVTAYLSGYHGDTSKTFLVGSVDQQGVDLVERTKEALDAAINICGPDVPFSEIGRTIERHATRHGFTVSSQFVGHGIGRLFHQKPEIKHCANDDKGIMRPGHCFTIEPSLVQGSNPNGWILPDGWTCLTESGARSAQFEHTLLITENGADILTSEKDV